MKHGKISVVGRLEVTGSMGTVGGLSGSFAQGEGALAIGIGSHSEGLGVPNAASGYLAFSSSDVGNTTPGVIVIAGDHTGLTWNTVLVSANEENSGPTQNGPYAVKNVTFDSTNTLVELYTQVSFSPGSYYIGLVGEMAPPGATIPRGGYSHVEGESTATFSPFSHAEGQGSKALGMGSHAEGLNTATYGESSHAEGYDTKVAGDYSHAEGNLARAGHMAFSADNLVAGVVTLNSTYGDLTGTGEIVGKILITDGTDTREYDIDSVAWTGTNTTITLTDPTASGGGYPIGIIGNLDPKGADIRVGDGAHAEGYNSAAMSSYSHAEGYETRASGYASHAEGESTVASQYAAHAEGGFMGAGPVASGIASHAEGVGTIAGGIAAHSEGNFTKAFGWSSHAEGSFTRAVNEGSHTEGTATFACTVYSVITNVDTGLNEITVVDASLFSVGDKVTYVYAASGNNNQLNDTVVTAVDTMTGIVTVENTTSIGSGAWNSISNYVMGGQSVLYNLTQGYDTETYSHAEGSYTTAVGINSHAEGRKTAALGEHSHAEGVMNKAEGIASHAEGSYTRASGDYSHSEGGDTQATGDYSHAEGNNTTASGDYSHAEGNYTTASGLASHAEGDSTTVSGNYSHAEGRQTVATGEYSHAEGASTTASGDYSHAEGWLTEASGTYSHAEGTGALASGGGSHAEGYYTTGSGQWSHAEGDSTTASGGNSHAEGFHATASGSYSHAEGRYTIAFGGGSHAEGDSTTASGDYSHAEGENTLASGIWSHAEGSSTTAYGNASHAEGLFTIASGSAQHVGGKYNKRDNNFSLFVIGDGIGDPDVDRNDVFRVNTGRVEVTGSFVSTLGLSGSLTQLADGTSYLVAGPNITITSASNGAVTIEAAVPAATPSYWDSLVADEVYTTGSMKVDGNAFITGTFASGYGSIASGQWSHAEGQGTTASGDHSHAEGESTTASGPNSHAEGYQTTASGMYSHAEGWNTVASGEYGSHAEGHDTIAEGWNSHAEGRGTRAAGLFSHAAGTGSQALNEGSYAGGLYTVASGTYQMVVGKYNSLNNGTSLFVVGGGTSENNRKDSFIVNASETATYGNALIFGNFFVTGTVSIDTLQRDPATIGSDVFMFVSGSISGSGAADKKAVFAGDVRISGSLSQGNGTTASGYASHAEGASTTSSGGGSHAEGQNTTASAVGSHAEGQNTTASGDYSHAEGDSTTASGYYSHAEGYQTIASGDWSHAEGDSTTAVGEASHAEGRSTTAVGNYSHAEGFFTIASGSFQHVGGRFNKRGNNFSLFVIGDGIDEPDVDRSDILRVNAGNVGGQGSLQLTGSLYVSGTATFDSLGRSTSMIGSDVFFFVSGSVAGSGANNKRAVFGGDMVVSGAYLLNVQSGTLGTVPVVLLVSSSHHFTVFTKHNVTASLPLTAPIGTQLMFKDGTGLAAVSGSQMLSCSLGGIDNSATFTLPAINYTAVTIVKVNDPDTWMIA